MPERPFIDLAREREERPDQEAITSVASDAFADATCGAVRAIASVTLLVGGRCRIAAFCGLSDADKRELRGALMDMADEIGRAKPGYLIEIRPGLKD